MRTGEHVSNDLLGSAHARGPLRLRPRAPPVPARAHALLSRLMFCTFVLMAGLRPPPIGPVRRVRRRQLRHVLHPVRIRFVDATVFRNDAGLIGAEAHRRFGAAKRGVPPW